MAAPPTIKAGPLFAVPAASVVFVKMPRPAVITPPCIVMLVSRFKVVVALLVTPIGYNAFVVSSVVVAFDIVPVKLSAIIVDFPFAPLKVTYEVCAPAPAFASVSVALRVNFTFATASSLVTSKYVYESSTQIAVDSAAVPVLVK